MKSKRFWLLLACFTILNALLTNAVIFDEPRSRGYSFGSSGFGVGLSEFYDAYYSFIDFFLFLLIFGGLAKTVFKGDESHHNALAIGLATALSLGLTLYMDNEGIKLFDFGPWIAGLVIILLIALVWRIFYNLFGHKKWLLASLLTLAIVLLGMMITSAIRGESATAPLQWQVAKSGMSFGTLFLFLIIVLPIIAGLKHFAKNREISGESGHFGGGHNNGNNGRNGGGHAGPGTSSMPPLRLVDDPSGENIDVVVREKNRLILECIRKHAVAINFLDKFFYETNNFDEIKKFLDLYLLESKIKFAKGLKMKFKDFSAYLAKHIFPDFEKALSLDYPADISSKVSPHARAVLTDLYEDLQDAIDLYNQYPVIHANHLGPRVNFEDSWTKLSKINSADPAERAQAAQYFSDNVIIPMDNIFKTLQTIVVILQRELASS